jgi:hypothetical protein
MSTDNYETSLTDKLPDHDIEEYWLYVKQSMHNFYGQTKLLPRPIENWSAALNQLQKGKKYIDIEFHIMKYLSLYSIDLLRLGNQYYINILITNLKRWDKITEKYKFFSRHDDKSTGITDKNIAIVLLEIVYSLLKSETDFSDLFDDIELYIIYEDFEKLIKFAVTHNKPSILDKLIEYDYLNVVHAVDKIYGTDLASSNLSVTLCGKKIIKTILDL